MAMAISAIRPSAEHRSSAADESCHPFLDGQPGEEGLGWLPADR